MKLIVITRPDFFADEAQWIAALMQAGDFILHLRKPSATLQEVKALLDDISQQYYSRIVLHDHFELATRYNLRGVHLNNRNPKPPVGYEGCISRSCHTLQEVVDWKPRCVYVTLSPIFDSVSKEGYESAFTLKQLKEAHQAGLIDEQVVALGGVVTDNIRQLRTMGFGGCAVLGTIWQAPSLDEAASRLKKLIAEVEGTIPCKVLSIAGSDPSGGAGIQADIKAISALGGYAATAITALTVQNTRGVQRVFPLPADLVSEQIDAVMSDIEPQAIKIGMVNDAAVVQAIVAAIHRHHPAVVVYDPVMVSTSGHRLIEESIIALIEKELMPLATIITPNMQEAAVLYNNPIENVEEMKKAATYLAQRYGNAVLIKGGHLDGDTMCDILSDGKRIISFTERRIDTRNLHGTGCTLSSAIATLLAQGRTIEQAVSEAKQYVTRAIQTGSRMLIGHDNGPLWHQV